MTEESNSIQAFVTKQRELLELELQAENDNENDMFGGKTSASKSSSGGGGGGDGTKGDEEIRPTNILGQLEATDTSVGLYGRTVVQLSVISSSSSSSSSHPIATALVSSPGGGSDSSNSDEGMQTKHWKSSSLSTGGSGSLLLPAHRFTVGDEVEIRGKSRGSTTNKNRAVGGVINAVSDTFISVTLFQGSRHSHSSSSQNKNNSAASSKKKQNSTTKKSGDSNVDEDEQTNELLQQVPLTLVPRSSMEVHRKMMKALDTLNKYGVDHPVAGEVVKAMFYPSEIIHNNGSNQKSSADRLPPFNHNLDHSQLDAIDFVLDEDRKIALIHGPPGTGKGA
jgi:hypothetical protein